MTKELRSFRLYAPVTFVLLTLVGCGSSNEAIIPSGELTDQQKAAYAAEMASVEEQESQGNINSIGKKKKK